MFISTGISELYTQRLERHTTALRIPIAADLRRRRARLYC